MSVIQRSVAEMCEAGLAERGFAIVDRLVTAPVLDAMRECSASILAENLQEANRGGVRNPFRRSGRLRGLCTDGGVDELARNLLGPGAFITRAILFDKTADSNWAVPWHQDVTIAVRERVETPGFGPWSVKDGVAHVRPPAEVLAGMLTIRVHLDDCGADNGPLRVLPGSHGGGLLGERDIDAWTERARPVECTGTAGSAVLMRPLILHSSLKAVRPGSRRVLHLEYACEELPGALRFAQADS